MKLKLFRCRQRVIIEQSSHEFRHDGKVESISWTSDGSFFASGSWDGTVHVMCPARKVAITLTETRNEHGEFHVSCTNMAGEEIAHFDGSLGVEQIRSELAAHLRCSKENIALVGQDARLINRNLMDRDTAEEPFHKQRRLSR